MVKLFFFTLFFLGQLFGASESKVEVVLDQTVMTVDIPVSGTIIITHPSTEAVDVASFSYKGKNFPVEHLRKVEFPGSEGVSVNSYRFKLDAFPKGPQMMSPVSVKVGKNIYTSQATAFEVRGRTDINSRRNDSPSVNPTKTPILKIEKIYSADGPLYPGQKIQVGYRYLFEGDIELQEETVPLLDQKQFKKLGEKIIQDRQEGKLSIREITQTIEVQEPGSFTIPKSVVAGYAVQDRGWGPKTYLEPKLISEIPAFKIEVKPFPEKGRPVFFTDAMGPLKMEARVVKPPKLEIGDKFLYELTFSGGGDLSTVKAPNLMCQPGWSGFFQVGDLPPQGQKKPSELTFQYELRPLTSWAAQIPPVWFAYFNPREGKYETLSTKPTDLSVTAPPRAAVPPKKPPQEIAMKASFSAPEGLEISKISEWETKLNRELESPLSDLVEHPLGGQGASFYSHLARAFAELERYPESIWAYQKAYSLNPLNYVTKASLFDEQKKLQLPEDASFRVPLFIWYASFFLFLLLTILTFRFKIISILFGLVAAFSLLGTFYSLWITPLEGVLLRSTYLYQSPSKQSAQVSLEPLPSGLKIEVLGFEEEGKWLKVKDKESNIGYIFYDSLKVI